MVNAHCHLELSHLKGAIAEGGGFAGFAAGLGAVRNGFSAVERADAMRRADEDMFRAGISAVGDVSNDASSFAAKSGSPIHYHTFLELYGLGHD